MGLRHLLPAGAAGQARPVPQPRGAAYLLPGIAPQGGHGAGGAGAGTVLQGWPSLTGSIFPQSVVQSYLEGVQTGVWQLARAIEVVQGTREALSQARGLLQGMSQALQTLEPLRERVAQHKQLQALSHLLPRLRAGEHAGTLGLSLQ